MLKKLAIALILPLIFLLSACSSLQLPWTSSTTGQTSQTVEEKLAVGILKLNDTSLSVTAAQAQDLLSLWKGVKSLGASSTASSDEMAALYAQIQGRLTADQVQAIQQMSLTSADIDALMQKYSVQTAPSASTDNTTSQSTQSGSSQPAGPDGGGMPAGGDPNVAAGAALTGQTGAQSNSVVVQVGDASQTSTNVLLANSVISMLEQLLNA
jgi:hypothetical protein